MRRRNWSPLTLHLFLLLVLAAKCPRSQSNSLRLSLSSPPSSCNISDMIFGVVRSSRQRLDVIAAAKSNLHQQQQQQDQSPWSTTFDAHFSKNSYQVILGLGSDPVRYVKLMVDSGSELSWLQCEPCQQCFSQDGAIYDPRSSSSYHTVGCNDRTCMLLGKRRSRCREECLYRMDYKDGSWSSGELGRETLVLDSFSRGFDLVQEEEIELVFGCGVRNSGSFGMSAGVFGLARGPLSVISQLKHLYGNVFVTCFPRMLDSSSTGYLQFGSDGIPITEVRYTPFYSRDFYSVKLEAITVGDQRLDARSGDPDIGTVVDSGCTVTALDSGLFTQLKQALQEHLGFQEKVKDEYLDLCFRVDDRFTSSDMLESLPEIVFHFTDADVVLTPSQKIVRVDTKKRILCLGFMDNRGVGFHVFGALQQQETLVIYDLENQRIGFAPADC